MSNIRFRRYPDKISHNWELDCFVIPSNEIAGELIDYKQHRVKQFMGINKPDLFDVLSSLLTHINDGKDIPRNQIKLSIATFDGNKRTYYYLRALSKYSLQSPEAEIWKLVDSILAERLKEITV